MAGAGVRAGAEVPPPEAGLLVTDGSEVEGYASVFRAADQGGDVVQAGRLCPIALAAGGAGRAGQDAVAA